MRIPIDIFSHFLGRIDETRTPRFSIQNPDKVLLGKIEGSVCIAANYSITDAETGGPLIIDVYETPCFLQSPQ